MEQNACSSTAGVAREGENGCDVIMFESGEEGGQEVSVEGLQLGTCAVVVESRRLVAGEERDGQRGDSYKGKGKITSVVTFARPLL